VYEDFLCDKVSVLDVAVKGRLSVLCDSTCLLVYAVVQVVEAPHYKPEGCGFDSQSGNLNFSLT